ncbi:antitoxin, partial [Rhizobium leguminosarum]|nr:antitoxin [Rhizobium leguminosarum]NEK56246.1 antitoxin [Rhizobium leguminosarum]
AHDLVYCLEHGEGGLAGAIAKFQEALKGNDREVIERALTLLLQTKATCAKATLPWRSSKLKVLPDDTEIREARILRQRAVNDIMLEFLSALGIAFK